MAKIEFGSKKAANETRSKVKQFLTRGDDGREKTVKLKASTPDKIVKRVEQAAFESREGGSRGAGKADLSDSEQRSLERQHDTFSWQQHGFEAMAVKGAMQAEGVTEWQDYYEPGEGVDSAMAKLRSKKQQGQYTRASIGIEGDRTDTEEIGNTGRRSRQAEQARAQQTKGAKRPAVVDADADAVEYIREEQRFADGDVFDISVTGEGAGLSATGADMALVEERQDARSAHARLTDDLRAAEITKDPIAWAQNPGKYDFPGVDTLEPEKVHARRSEAAQEVDENELAPKAESRRQWAKHPDQYDWPGVDTPAAMGLGPNEPDPDPPALNELPDETERPDAGEFTGGKEILTGTGLAPEDWDPEHGANEFMGARPATARLSADAYDNLASGVQADMALDTAERQRGQINTDDLDVDPGSDVEDMGLQNDLMADTRAKQDTLGFAADPTEARESRLDQEENPGGIMADKRESVDRGAATNDPDAGEQGQLVTDEGDAGGISREVDRAMKDMDADLSDMDL